jgi:hypothetical protein
MNKKQRIIISIGILLVILSGLFPPYEGEFRREGDNLKKYMGHHFLFLPPNERAVYIAVFDRTPKRMSWIGHHGKLNSHIVASRVWVQVVTIVVATIGFLFLFAEKREDE